MRNGCCHRISKCHPKQRSAALAFHMVFPVGQCGVPGRAVAATLQSLFRETLLRADGIQLCPSCPWPSRLRPLLAPVSVFPRPSPLGEQRREGLGRARGRCSVALASRAPALPASRVAVSRTLLHPFMWLRGPETQRSMGPGAGSSRATFAREAKLGLSWRVPLSPGCDAVAVAGEKADVGASG